MKERILIVDDDPSMVRLIEHILRLENYEIHSVKDGALALQKAREIEPDVIILDVILPGCDGFEICDSLRSDPDTGTIPIVMLSRRKQELDRAQASHLGADFYLSKPPDPIELRSEVRTLIAKRSKSRPTPAERPIVASDPAV